MNLTPTQTDAITHKGGNLQLIACAGSGKTEVVARRVVYLLTPGGGGGLAPRNIIAFTYTDKAAAELKERIITRCREALGDVTGLAEMFVGTIHAFCLDLLKTEVPKYLKYEVLNEVQQGLFVDRHSKQSGLTSATDLRGSALKRYRDTPRYIEALSILREAEPVDSALNGCSVMDGLDAYRKLLDERSYLDYSAILEAAVDVMTNQADLQRRLAGRSTRPGTSSRCRSTHWMKRRATSWKWRRLCAVWRFESLRRGVVQETTASAAYPGRTWPSYCAA
ncbi:MAG: UvrD-helicase domain-containing protein [Acidobacteriota bacterium]